MAMVLCKSLEWTVAYGLVDQPSSDWISPGSSWIRSTSEIRQGGYLEQATEYRLARKCCRPRRIVLVSSRDQLVSRRGSQPIGR